MGDGGQGTGVLVPGCSGGIQRCGVRSVEDGGRRRTGADSWVRAPAGCALILLSLALFACSKPDGLPRDVHLSASPLTPADFPRVNFGHLDHLLEIVERDGVEYGLVHIYAEAPDYTWVHDDDEGAACVDDAARAAVVYLRDYELNGRASSRRKAEALIRFVLYMQAENGLFYNFVWQNDLEINRDHANSRADELSFWTARAVWALGRCAQVLEGGVLASECRSAVERTYPHLEERLQLHGRTFERNGRTYPRWLLHETASDATSELLLGLAAMPRSPRLDGIVDGLVDGIRLMQYGRVGEFPYGAHASWTEVWHAWGNAQSQALTALARGDAAPGESAPGDMMLGDSALAEEASRYSAPGAQGPPSTDAARAGEPLVSAIHESTHFYPTLLVDGWRHSIDFADPAAGRQFEQIAYGVRGVALGLAGLYEVTGDERFAVLAGLAASWLTGNNVARTPMYDPQTGRGFDGITDSVTVNRNAGAESTIEALMTILEIGRIPAARQWILARGERPLELARDGNTYRYRVFRTPTTTIAVVLNLTDRTSMLLEGEALVDFLSG